MIKMLIKPIACAVLLTALSACTDSDSVAHKEKSVETLADYQILLDSVFDKIPLEEKGEFLSKLERGIWLYHQNIGNSGWTSPVNSEDFSGSVHSFNTYAQGPIKSEGISGLITLAMQEEVASLDSRIKQASMTLSSAKTDLELLKLLTEQNGEVWEAIDKSAEVLVKGDTIDITFYDENINADSLSGLLVKISSDYKPFLFLKPKANTTRWSDGTLHTQFSIGDLSWDDKNTPITEQQWEKLSGFNIEGVSIIWNSARLNDKNTLLSEVGFTSPDITSQFSDASISGFSADHLFYTYYSTTRIVKEYSDNLESIRDTKVKLLNKQKSWNKALVAS